MNIPHSVFRTPHSSNDNVVVDLFPTGIGLISPRHFQAAVSRFTAILQMGALSGAIVADDNAPWYTKRDVWGEALPKPSKAGSTAIVPVEGVITSGLPRIYRAFGYADTGEIAGWVRAAAEDPKVKKIVLKIDSPGGMVSGTPELADEVDRASGAKPVEGHTSGMMDSAAYWIGSQADALFCTPSADVGCIGVYQMNYDFTEFLKKFGVKAEMFKSGDLKGTGHEDVALSDAQRENIQKDIDLIGAQFRSAVTGKRVFVEDDSMRGQSFIGVEAAERGLVAACKPFEALL